MSESLNCYLSLTSSPSAPRGQLTLPLKSTASDLRRLASEATSVPLTALKLIFRGRVIPDKSEGDVIGDFKLENDCVIHVMGKPLSSSGGAAATTSATTGGIPSSMPAGASVSLPSGTAAPASTSGAGASPLSAALVTLRSSNSADVYRTALTTADKLLGNIISHPQEEKYRSVKKANPAFQRRLGGVAGGDALILAAGFVVETGEGGAESYVLRPSAEAWPRLVAAGEEVKRVLGEANTPSFAPPPNAAPGGAAAGGMSNLFPGGMPGGGMPGGPGMEAAAQNLLGNPEMLQNMLSVSADLIDFHIAHSFKFYSMICRDIFV